eukprot:scaffold34990_cov66-Phaeocystis_antarctica.AAC.2
MICAARRGLGLGLGSGLELGLGSGSRPGLGSGSGVGSPARRGVARCSPQSGRACGAARRDRRLVRVRVRVRVILTSAWSGVPQRTFHELLHEDELVRRLEGVEQADEVRVVEHAPDAHLVVHQLHVHARLLDPLHRHLGRVPLHRATHRGPLDRGKGALAQVRRYLVGVLEGAPVLRNVRVVVLDELVEGQLPVAVAVVALQLLSHPVTHLLLRLALPAIDAHLQPLQAERELVLVDLAILVLVKLVEDEVGLLHRVECSGRQHGRLPSVRSIRGALVLGRRCWPGWARVGGGSSSFRGRLLRRHRGHA